MKFKQGYYAIVTGLLFCLFVTGCTSYYQVHDVSTDKTYYTTDIKHKASGAVVFKDHQSGANVVLQESETKKISKERFKENTSMP